MAYKLITALRYEEQLDSILHYVAEELHNKTAAKLIYKEVKEAYKFLKVFPMATPVCSDEILETRGYRKYVLQHHDYVIILGVENDTVILKGIFHCLENYIEDF